MKAATTAEQCQNLDDLIAEVVSDAEPTLLANQQGHHAVLLSLDEYNSWQETLYLLSNPANAAHLRESIAEAEAGRVVEKELIDFVKLAFTESAWSERVLDDEERHLGHFARSSHAQETLPRLRGRVPCRLAGHRRAAGPVPHR